MQPEGAPRVLLDQGLPARAAEQLRQIGWDAVHVSELGLQTAEDVNLLQLACAESRVAVTLDRDFPQILALTAARQPSVIPIRLQGLRAPELCRILSSAWQQYRALLEAGCVLQIGSKGVRARALPLR